MFVYLIRHGEAAVSHQLYGRTPGVALSEAGREQVARLTEHLNTKQLAAIYSSPLERAIESAKPIALAKGLAIRTSDAFLEVDQGDWTGLSWPELHEHSDWHCYNTYRSGTSCPNGEMAIEVQARVVRELQTLLDRHSEQPIAIFSHADVIRAAVCHYAGIPLDLSLRLEISPGSISTLKLRRDGVTIHEVNRTFA